MDKNKNEQTYIETKPILTLSDIRDLLDIVYLINSLLKNNGSITHVAEELDIGRRTVYDLMEKYGVSCTDGKLSIRLTPLVRHIELRAPYVEKYIS